MARLKLALFTILIFTLAASLYGAIHNQVTYSISPEYFTKFKFHQFQWAFADFTVNIGSEDKPEYIMSNNRISASLVGILATWWFGLLMEIVFVVTSFLKGMTTKHTVLLFTYIRFIFGITIVIGSVASLLCILEVLPNICLLDNVTHTDHFSHARWIHNFSYLGGLVAFKLTLFIFLKRPLA